MSFVVSQGNHGFDLRATAGTKHASIPTYAFAIDQTAPAITITGHPPSPSASATSVFSFAVSDGTTSCGVDGTGLGACASGVTVGPLADGNHQFFVDATDAAGNWSSASYTWFIDTTAPSIGTISYYCDSSGELEVDWTASDAGTGIVSETCSYGGLAYDCTGQTSWFGSLRPTGSFVVTATDQVGNTRSRVRLINASICTL